MLTRGCLILTFFVYHALSLPVSSDHMNKENAKVMKCIVEVIADTLSKPSPLPVSQECLDALRGGTSERAQKQKKSSNLADHISGVLHNDKDAEAGSESDSSKNISEEDKDEKISEKEDSEDDDKKSAEDKVESRKAGEESLHGNVAEREEKSSKAEVEGQSKWLNKMDELAEQLSSKKRSREEEEEENSTESLQAPLPKSPLLDGALQRHLTSEKHHSKEASVEEDGSRSLESAELQMMRHPDVEEKREEEGSANRKPEVGISYQY
ncbi:UNVERIFIED_CONTAM: hypothetical protein FKN15_078356 [Acipenser sinensis]